MLPRRNAALAQALAILLILVPGLAPAGPSPVTAAVDPRPDEASVVLQAAGKGIGCQTGRRAFNGPRPPGDPPLPPGSKPEPTPDVVEPEPSPAVADPSTAAGPEPGVGDDTTPEPSDDTTAAGPTMLLASTGVRVAQADPTADPESAPAGDGEEEAGTTVEPDAPAGEEPRTRPKTRRQARRAGLIPGIDVSHHNGVIDYDQVHKTGRRFVFIKATQDTSFIDPLFPSNMSRARASGLAAGAYHFFDYTLDGKAQADHFLDRVLRADGIDGALPPVVDVECWAPIGSSTHVVAEARLRDFVERVYERTGRLPIVYTSVHMWREVTGEADGFSLLPLWAACWGCDLPPSIAPGWDDWMFWQTGIDRVPGVKRLDGNFFNGSEEDLDALRLRPFSIEEGSEVTGERRVRLDLGGRDAIAFRTSFDGETWTSWESIRGAARAQLEDREGEQTLFVQLRAGPGLKSPVYSDAITLDMTGPSMSAPTITLREGPFSDTAVLATVRWLARDELAGLSDAEVEVACPGGGGAAAVRTEAPGSAPPGVEVAWEGETLLSLDGACDVAVIGRDGVGNVTVGSALTVTAEHVSEAPSVDVEYAGEWRAVDDVTASGGTARTSASDAASVTVTLEGTAVGIVALTGPEGGRAAVMIDDAAVGLLDTYAPAPSGPRVVFSAELEPGAPHRIRLEPLGTSDSAALDAQVALDGFLVLR